MRRRRLWIAILLLLVAAAITSLVLLRRHAAPEAVRLLPEADAVLFVDLGLVRVGTEVPQIPEVHREADYAAFVRETGFEFERDLDELALAVRYLPPQPSQPGTPPSGFPSPPYRSSEVLVGRFHTERLTAYLKKLAQGSERYRASDIYHIPYEGRTVRVALLGVDMVAVSNEEDPGVMHGIIDRYHELANPVGGPGLVREHYRRVPLGSLAWAIGRVPAAPGGAATGGAEPLGMLQKFAGGSTLVASLRYTGSLQCRVEAVTASEGEAKQLGASAETLLALFRGAGPSVHGEGPDPDVKAFFDSIEIRQDEQSLVVSATLPGRAIRKVLGLAPAMPAPPPPVPDTKKPPPSSGRRAK